MTIIALFRHLAQKDRDTGFDFLSRLHAAARGVCVCVLRRRCAGSRAIRHRMAF